VLVVPAMTGVTFTLTFVGAPVAVAGMIKARRHGRGDLAILYFIVALLALIELPAIYLILRESAEMTGAFGPAD